MPRTLSPIARLLVLWFALAPGLAAAGPDTPGYTHHRIGDPAAQASVRPRAGLLLMGGGDLNQEALRWFFDRAGHGRIVVLRTSQGGEIGEEFHDDIGGVASVETFVFADRAAAADPAILRAIEGADGIFIADGDQSRYVRLWRGTPLATALTAHANAGKPLAGTGAGLAILGEFFHGHMDGGSRTRPAALADPLGEGDAIESGFLDIAALRGILIDTHSSEPNRHGRLAAFMPKAERMTGRSLLGLGVDEGAALVVDGDGSARIYATTSDAGATLVRASVATRREGTPLQQDRIRAQGVGADSVLHLPEGRIEHPAFDRSYSVRDGVLVAIDAPVLVIHGGAGVVRAGSSEAERVAARKALEAALRAGHERLQQGAAALDAVTAAITVLEDAPQFNAGRGAVFTHDGRNELDASIMDGASQRAGAAAGVSRVRHPILLARAIMENSPHVMMAGEGAEAFAKEQSLELVDPAWFRTEKRWQQLQDALRVSAESATGSEDGRPYFGTVGAVALDARGQLAAGTSTGGMTNKRFGRVGDSPIIGAGTWADARCAVSGTGWGEFYIRAAAAHEICARMRLSGHSAARAGSDVINRDIPAAGGDGGAIVLASDGSFALPFNTEGMYRGWIGADGVPHVAVFADEVLRGDVR